MADSARRRPSGSRLRAIAGWPARRVLDPRIKWVHDYIDQRLGSDDVRAPVHIRLDELEARLDSLLRALGRIRSEQIEPDATSPTLADLSRDLATLLNWNEGPDGLPAQAGLWFNPPVPVEHFEGRIDVLLVNERIVEQPFVFAEIGRFAGDRRLRILDVGGSESTVGLSLASLGHEVHVVDPRGLRLEHPNLTAHACVLEDLPVGEPFDVAIALSSVEHFGLGSYGTESQRDSQADRQAVTALQDHVRPDGLLILTVPLAATASDDEFQRTYDWPRLLELLGDWRVAAAHAAWRKDRLTWTLGPIDQPHGEQGVALVVATNGVAPELVASSVT